MEQVLAAGAERRVENRQVEVHVRVEGQEVFRHQAVAFADKETLQLRVVFARVDFLLAGRHLYL